MLFKQFSDLLGAGEQLHFTVARTGDGQLKLLLTPILGEPPEDLPEAAAQARAALALPLTLTAPPEELDGGAGGGFLAILADYAATRAGIKDSLNTLTLDTLKRAAAGAGAAAVKARQRAGAADTAAQAKAPPPAPPATTAQAVIPPPQGPHATPADANPDSLF